jgi:hypothetical protein
LFSKPSSLDRIELPKTNHRLFNIIQVIDIRETRQLCLGEPIPATISEEASLLFAEAEVLLSKKRGPLSQGTKKQQGFRRGQHYPLPDIISRRFFSFGHISSFSLAGRNRRESNPQGQNAF